MKTLKLSPEKAKKNEQLPFLLLLIESLGIMTFLFFLSCTTPANIQSSQDDDDLYSTGNKYTPDQPVVSNTNENATNQTNPNEGNLSDNRYSNDDNSSQNDTRTFYRTDDPEYNNDNYQKEEKTVVKNYYYDDYVDADDYYDYAYSSRIRRFHRPYSGFGYYDNAYTNYYFYNNDPAYWGVSIYSSYSWWGPGIYYSYDPWVGSSWGLSFGWSYPYNSYCSPVYYHNYGFPYYSSYHNSYSHGYAHGYSDAYYGSSGYYNSYDKNSYYYYGPSDSRASSSMNTVTERPLFNKNGGRLSNTSSSQRPVKIRDSRNSESTGNDDNTNPGRPNRNDTKSTATQINAGRPSHNNTGATPVNEGRPSRQNETVTEPQKEENFGRQGRGTGDPSFSGRPGRPVKRSNWDENNTVNQNENSPVMSRPTVKEETYPRPSGRPVKTYNYRPDEQPSNPQKENSENSGFSRPSRVESNPSYQAPKPSESPVRGRGNNPSYETPSRPSQESRPSRSNESAPSRPSFNLGNGGNSGNGRSESAPSRGGNSSGGSQSKGGRPPRR